MTAYGLLALAVAAEVIATLSLRASNGFTRLGPSLLVVGGYAFAFLLLSLVLQRGLDVAVVYALWSAAGIVVITLVGALWLGETLAPVQVLGMFLIVVGVLALELGARVHA